MSSARSPLASWPAKASAVLVVAGIAAAALTPAPARAVGAVVAVAVVAMFCTEDDDRLAWWWGFLIPIDFVKDVPAEVFDLARYGGLVWIVLRFKPDLTATRRRTVLAFAAMVAVVAVIKGVASVARMDSFAIFIAAAMAVGAVTAPFIAYRVRTHITILAGFCGGVILSASVSILQSQSISLLRDGNSEGERYPGLASTTMLITWHLAFALIIACYFLVVPNQRRLFRVTSMALVPLALVALVVNGAQGGLAGLAFAALATVPWAWKHANWKVVSRVAALGLVAVVALGAVFAATDLATPTLDGLRGDGGYRNEIARVRVAEDGLRTTLENPLTGVGRTNFEDGVGRGIAPHFLPLEAGVTAGVAGLLAGAAVLGLLAWVIVRGPVGERSQAWLGLALCGAMFANALTETGGPFTGLPRFALLLIAVVACRGEDWPGDQPADASVSASTTSDATRSALPPA